MSDAVAHGFLQGRLERVEAKTSLRAELDGLKRNEIVRSVCGWMADSLRRSVALALDQYQRAGRSTESAQVIEPVWKRTVTNRKAVFLVRGLCFQLRRPENQEDRPPLQKQRMRAVIHLLAPKIPKVQPNRRCKVLELERHLAELDSMGCGDARVIAQTAQSTAPLRLTRSPVAQHEDFELGVLCLASPDIRVVGADLCEDIFVPFVAANFSGQVVKLAFEKVELSEGD
jgi:hypothetical protein